MSSLYENVRRRQAAEPAALICVSLQAGGSALVVCQWEAATWVLPWSHFRGAQLTAPESDSPLELRFTECRVVLSGTNLRGLVDDLAAQRVGCLRDLPADYRPQTPVGAPHIATIEVRPATGGIRETPG